MRFEMSPEEHAAMMAVHWEQEPSAQIERELDDAVKTIIDMVDEARQHIDRLWTKLDNPHLTAEEDGAIHTELANLYDVRQRAAKLTKAVTS